MSNNFKTPPIVDLSAPINLDRPLEEIRKALAGLSWLEKSFGRSFDAIKSSKGSFGINKTLVYPHVWQGPGADLLEVMPNDNFKSYSFIRVEDPVEVLEFVPDRYSMMRAKIGVIVWYNLKRIDSTINYEFSEALKADVQRILTTMLFTAGSSLEIVKIWTRPSEVFKGYDISALKDQELVYPYGGFRFECNVTYSEDCPA
jgi:hypothetical protein